MNSAQSTLRSKLTPVVLVASGLINKATEHTQSCAQWFKRRVGMRAIRPRKVTEFANFLSGIQLRTL
jgi:hypothetical protein